MNATNKNTTDNKQSGFLKKTAIIGATIGALTLGSGIKDGKSEQVNKGIDDNKSKVSEVLNKLPIDLSKEIVKGMAINDTRRDLLMAKNDINIEKGEYREIIQILGKKEFVERFNQLDETQKRFAVKLYEAGKDDPLLLKEYSNKWLAINCVGLMERVTNLKHIIRTGDLEDGKNSDLTMKLEMILEACPSTQILLTSTMVSKFKEIETNAVLRLQEELRIAKEGLAKSKEGLAKSKEGLAKSKEGLVKEEEGLVKEREELTRAKEELKMLNALLVSSI